MNLPTAFRSLFGVSLGAVAVAALVGCGGLVTKGGGDTSNGGSGGSAGSAGTGGVGGDVGGDAGSGAGGACDPTLCGTASNAIAMTGAQLDAATGSGTGTGPSTGSGPGLDPNTQFLLYGSGIETPTCSLPFGGSGCGGWHVTVSIAPALFQIGVLPLSDPGVDLSFSESMDGGNGTCSGGGGGGFDQGQIEILDITPTAVHFTVSGVTDVFDFEVNGDYTADRCP